MTTRGREREIGEEQRKREAEVGRKIKGEKKEENNSISPKVLQIFTEFWGSSGFYYSSLQF